MTPAEARAKAEELWDDMADAWIDYDPECRDDGVPLLARALLLAQAEAVEACERAAREIGEILCPWTPEKPDMDALARSAVAFKLAAGMRDSAVLLRRAAEEIK